MKKKPSKKTPGRKMLGPTLQELDSIPVTDPVEFAEMDRRCRAAMKEMAEADKIAEEAAEKAGMGEAYRRSRDVYRG
jgi:hypothetical protein